MSPVTQFNNNLAVTGDMVPENSLTSDASTWRTFHYVTGDMAVMSVSGSFPLLALAAAAHHLRRQWK